MFKRHDWLLFTIIIILSIVGIFTLLSTNITDTGEVVFSGVVSKQAALALIGVIVYFIVSSLDLSYLKFPQLIIPIYVFTSLLLMYLLIWGDTIANVKRWIIIGGIQVQPSEIAKITLIITSASILINLKKLDPIIKGALVICASIPILVLIYLEPHGSMTMISTAIIGLILFTYLEDQIKNFIMIIIFLSILVGMVLLFYSNNNIGIVFLVVGIIISIYSFFKHESWRSYTGVFLLLGLILSVFVTVFGDKIIKEYMGDRIETFLNFENVDDDQKFNVRQSQIAIGSGGLFGKGFGSGTQSRLQFLPEHQTDFIFASFAEQYGLVGSVIILGLYIFLIIKILLLSMKLHKTDLFSSIIVFGLGMKFLIELFINIGTNLGIIPATGIPLPFMSAGGTNLIITFFSFGLIQSIICYAEFDHSTVNVVDNEELLI